MINSIKFNVLVRHKKEIHGEIHECVDVLPQVIVNNHKSFEIVCLRAAKKAYNRLHNKDAVIEICLSSWMHYPIMFTKAVEVHKSYPRAELEQIRDSILESELNENQMYLLHHGYDTIEQIQEKLNKVRV